MAPRSSKGDCVPIIGHCFWSKHNMWERSGKSEKKRPEMVCRAYRRWLRRQTTSSWKSPKQCINWRESKDLRHPRVSERGREDRDGRQSGAPGGPRFARFASLQRGLDEGAAPPSPRFLVHSPPLAMLVPPSKIPVLFQERPSPSGDLMRAFPLTRGNNRKSGHRGISTMLQLRGPCGVSSQDAAGSWKGRAGHGARTEFVSR
jgi:hypothetical protein